MVKVVEENVKLRRFRRGFQIFMGVDTVDGSEGLHLGFCKTLVNNLINYLEPQTTMYKWLFQLDDSQSLHRKWLFHKTSIFLWLFGVPGIYYLVQDF